MSKIVRRPDRAEGGITEDEKLRMAEHSQMWIKRAYRTNPIEPDKITAAIKGLYTSANRKIPRIIIVPSPLVMRVASGFAAAIWQYRQMQKAFPATYNATIAAIDAATDAATRDATIIATDDATAAAIDAATHAATRDATIIATDAATDAAIYAATRNATDAATHAATIAATYNATIDATAAATDDAIDDAIDDATRDAIDDATRAATGAATIAAIDAAIDDAVRSNPLPGWAYLLAWEIAKGDRQLFDLMIACVGRSWNFVQYGNMYVAWDCYLTATRDILGLRLAPHEKYKDWEQATINGSYRAMHSEFCMVVDFPVKISRDERNRPHSDNGPSHIWRDGWHFYYSHGVRIPDWVYEEPEKLTVSAIQNEQNVEVRRVMIERYGLARYLMHAGAKKVHSDDYGILYELPQKTGEPWKVVHVVNSTAEPDGSYRDYFMRVDPKLRPLLKDGFGKPQEETARNAVASTFGMAGEEYVLALQT